MREDLRSTIEEIRSYTNEHAELQKAHHFLFDLPVPGLVGNQRLVILGINPGEVEHDRLSIPGATEETSLLDFHAVAKGKPSRGSKRWLSNAAFFCEGYEAVLSELFFWSSKDQSEFRQRFGDLWRSPHLQFCTQCNRKLFEAHAPAAIIFTGLSMSEHVADHFRLTKVGSHVHAEGKRLVEHYADDERPWFFTRHWSASFGFTKDMKQETKNYIHETLDRARRRRGHMSWDIGDIEHRGKAKTG